MLLESSQMLNIPPWRLLDIEDEQPFVKDIGGLYTYTVPSLALRQGGPVIDTHDCLPFVVYVGHVCLSSPLLRDVSEDPN